MSSPGQLFPANPSDPTVQQALAYQGLTSVPSNWATDQSGRLVDRDSGSVIGVGAPFSTQSSFLNELGHASPYIALATTGLGSLANLTSGGATGLSALTSGAKVAKPLLSIASDGSSGSSGPSMASPPDGSSGGSNLAKYGSLAAFAPLLYLMLNKQQNPGQLISSIPGGQELLNQSITQSRQQAPVRTAAMQQALNTLPNTAFGAGGRPNLSSLPTANYGPAAGNDSSSALATTLKLLGAGAGGFLLGNNVGGSLDLIKKLFGGGGGTQSSFASNSTNDPGSQGVYGGTANDVIGGVDPSAETSQWLPTDWAPSQASNWVPTDWGT